MLADIFRTGYHTTEMAGVGPGKSVVIYGGGPVGLMAAYSAVLKGASRVMVVDRHPDRPEGAQAAAGDLPGQRAATDRSDPRTPRAPGAPHSHTGPSEQCQDKGPGGNVPSLRRTVSPGAPQIQLSAVRLLLADGSDGQPGATGYAGPHLADAAQAGSAWARNGP
jgi:hypothetical protein